MRRASIILTDSGGVQEEAPSLGVPVLVLRSKTERQEAIEAETAQLVGTDPDVIVAHVNQILDSGGAQSSSRQNPFGDGRACERIGNALIRYCGRKSEIAESNEQWVACQHG
jgi:UDP-N-acetylglucosamine 2-epimerase